MSSEIPLPPLTEGKYAIVTCMDYRIESFKVFGIVKEHAYVMRNAGGNAKDALRSLIISQQRLGTKGIVLVKHTDCGMVTFSNSEIHAQIKDNLGVSADHIDFQPFAETEKAVQDDVDWLRNSEFIPADVKKNISGWVYDVKGGGVKRIT